MKRLISLSAVMMLSFTAFDDTGSMPAAMVK